MIKKNSMFKILIFLAMSFVVLSISVCAQAATQYAMWVFKDKFTITCDYKDHAVNENYPLRRPMDIVGPTSGIDSAYAPCDIVVKYIYNDGHVVGFESKEPVYLANGKTDYITFLLGHDDDISDLYIGKEISQGQPFYQEGNTGISTGAHIHMEVAFGKCSSSKCTNYFQYVRGVFNSSLVADPSDVFFLYPQTVVNNPHKYSYSWKEKAISVTATFDGNGGSVSQPTITVLSGSAIGTLPTATRANYTFAGWFTAASGGTQISATTTVTGDVTYYAHWTDAVAPTVTSCKVTNVTKDGYDVTVTATDNVAVTELYLYSRVFDPNNSNYWVIDEWLPTTGEVTKNDKEYTSTIHINFADFQNQKDTYYISGAYARDAAGNRSDEVRADLNVFWDGTAPTITSCVISNVTKDGYDVTVTAQDPSNVTGFSFGTWNDSIGQGNAHWDDVFPTAATTASATVHISVDNDYYSYKRDVKYYTNVYAVDRFGNKTPVGKCASVSTFIDGTAPVVDTTKTTITNVTSTGYDVVISATDNHELASVDIWTSIWTVDGTSRLKDWTWAGRAKMSGKSSTATIHVNFADFGSFQGVSYANTVRVTDAVGNCNQPDYKIPIVAHYDLGNNVTGACGDNVYWTLDKSTGTLRIYGTGEMRDFTMDEVRWNGLQESVKKVVVEPGVTEIGDYAFMNCVNLTSVELPEGITVIGNSAFRACTHLPAIELPSTVKTIVNFAFRQCNSMKTISIPEGVTYISYGMFSYAGFESVILPSTVKEIADAAFDGSEELSIVYFKDSESKWNGINLHNNSCLADMIKIYDYPYDNPLHNIMRIPAGTQIIETEAFSGVAADIIIIPTNVESIGARAFSNCPNLKYIVNLSDVSIAAPAGVKVVH